MVCCLEGDRRTALTASAVIHLCLLSSGNVVLCLYWDMKASVQHLIEDVDIKWALDKPFVELSGGWPRQTPLSCWRVVKLARARSLVLRSARLYGAQPPTHPAPLYSFHFLSANTPPALLMLWMRRLYVARKGEGELHQGCYIVSALFKIGRTATTTRARRPKGNWEV